MSAMAERFFENALDAIKSRFYDRALGLLVEAIKLKPEFTEAWVVRGNVLHAMERPFDALLHYDRAISVNPNKHDAWNNRGLAFADIGLWGEAELSFKKSAELMPAVEPHMGLANMYCTIMRLDDAEREYRAALEIDEGCLEAHFNLGVTLLGLGRWKEGFREYETRWRNTPYPPRAMRDYPKWIGEDLNGKRILLYPEQGYGDEIMSLRFAHTLKGTYPNCSIIVLARGPMLRLADTIRRAGIVVAPMHADGNWRADYSCPLLDVPMVMGTTPQTIPSRLAQYLHAPDLEMVAQWRARISALPPGLNVGLCWSSGTHMNTARAAMIAKSVQLPWLKGLAIPGVNLISLQKPRETIPDGFPITDWMDECHDFADTAALVEALDLVISVDTAVAHLAGALGKPVWNLVRFSGYWPWLAPDPAQRDPNKSIWYSSMKLFRQPNLANWGPPIERVVEELKTTVELWKQQPEGRA